MGFAVLFLNSKFSSLIKYHECLLLPVSLLCCWFWNAEKLWAYYTFNWSIFSAILPLSQKRSFLIVQNHNLIFQYSFHNGSISLEEPNNTCSFIVGHSCFQFADSHDDVSSSYQSLASFCNLIMMLVPRFASFHNCSRQTIIKVWPKPIPHEVWFGVIIEDGALPSGGWMAFYHREAHDSHGVNLAVYPVYNFLHKYLPCLKRLYRMVFEILSALNNLLRRLLLLRDLLGEAWTLGWLGLGYLR